MDKIISKRRAVLLAALGSVSCATPADMPAQPSEVIVVDRLDVRSRIVADTARNRFTKVFQSAGKEFDKLYEDNHQ